MLFVFLIGLFFASFSDFIFPSFFEGFLFFFVTKKRKKSLFSLLFSYGNLFIEDVLKFR